MLGGYERRALGRAWAIYIIKTHGKKFVTLKEQIKKSKKIINTTRSSSETDRTLL